MLGGKLRTGDRETCTWLPDFPEPNVRDSEIGANVVHVVFEVFPGVFGKMYTLEGKMYNLEQPEGMASYFGIALESTNLILGVLAAYVHTFLEGHIEWGKEPQVGPTRATITTSTNQKHNPRSHKSRITFKGNIGTGGFLTLPSSCTGTGPQTTTTLHVESYEGESEKLDYCGPLGTEGCDGVSPSQPVPFEPAFAAEPHEDTQSDQPDGLTTELSLPHNPSPTGIDTSQLKTATMTLPEGVTLNPSAARWP